ncbi:hypothetical protein [Nitrospira sp. Nam74]
MPIEFTHLHNLVRTYQRSLHLSELSKASTEPPHDELDDRVSISDEARDERRQWELHPGADPEADSSGSAGA